MKKALFALVALLFTFGIARAQEDGTQLAKNAGRALSAYAIDPANNQAKLAEAKQKIDQALQTPEAQALVSAWQTKGEIYSTIYEKDVVQKQFNPEAKMSGDNDALEAYKGYAKALELATKKFEKTDVLEGEIAYRKGNLQLAITLLRKGVEKEDNLYYDEPPDWLLSVRHNLGRVLMEAGQYVEAEKVYRADLKRYKENGWALIGLFQALLKQGKKAAAQLVKMRYETAWRYADIPLTNSVL